MKVINVKMDEELHKAFIIKVAADDIISLRRKVNNG